MKIKNFKTNLAKRIWSIMNSKPLESLGHIRVHCWIGKWIITIKTQENSKKSSQLLSCH